VSKAASWLLLAALSLAVSRLLQAGGVPGAILLGPMLCGMAFGVGGAKVRLPRPLFVMGQGVLGCLIAHSITATFLGQIAQSWPGMALSVAATVVASGLVGWVLARYGLLPASSVAWGASPGAASAQVAMAAENGADARLVAFMQYLRVICVVATASLASTWLAGAAAPAPNRVPVPVASDALDPLGLAVTLAVALGGSWLGQRLRVPTGGLLVPLVIGAVLNATGSVPISPPDWLLVAAYAGIGWYIGLQFERETLLRSLAAVPQLLLASFAVIALCSVSAWLLTRFEGTDPLTAFLATTPGGIDSVAVIALHGGADTPYIVAVQTLRLLVVLVTGGPIARWIIRTNAGR
jgi:membrane AbrB-like protein